MARTTIFSAYKNNFLYLDQMRAIPAYFHSDVNRSIITNNRKKTGMYKILIKCFSQVFLVWILMAGFAGCKQNTASLTRYVNPFIGTANGGNTFPGAVMPWGMVSVSPHNAPGTPSGYIDANPYFYGLGHVHLSGTGCADLGSVIITATRKEKAISPDIYKSRYSHQQAGPGKYGLYLEDDRISLQSTVTMRCGMTKFSSEENSEVDIVLDAGRSLSLEGGGRIKIDAPDRVSGYNITGGFCGEDNRKKVYYYAQFSRPFISVSVWEGEQITAPDSAEIKDGSTGGLFRFNLGPGGEVLLKVGISYTSEQNARLNLETEMPGWDFNQLQSAAEKAWQEQLEHIVVEGGREEDRVRFYTALYHMLIHPNIINDVNGKYPLMGLSGTGQYAEQRHRYSVFSLWDTYRTVHPFLTLVYPEIQSAMINTMLDMFHESGYLPKWELAGNETYMMVGDAATPVIADSYIKGVKGFSEESALAAVLKPVILAEGQKAPPVRAGYHELLSYKYIPFDQDMTKDWWVWGPVSTTLEYCHADWTISRMAAKMGREDIAEEFLMRSACYKNLFDSRTRFLRPRLANGTWLDPFDPLAKEGSGYWSGSGGPGYVEGNAWNYTWFVPHDIPGLIELFDGPEKFTAKLQACFDEGHFDITNEPDIAYPYLFTYIDGEEHRTRLLLKQLMADHFSTGPGGLPGNDDCGTISGWFVFSALGFYPACPGSDEYRLGIPLFDKATIRLNKDHYAGDQFVIEKTAGKQEQILLNGTDYPHYYFSHGDIVSGGSLVFIESKDMK